MKQRLWVGLALVALVACSKSKQPPAAQAGSGSATGSGAGSGSAAVAAADAGAAVAAEDAAVVAASGDAGIDAAVPTVACEASELKKVRKTADALVKAGKAEEAATLLAPIYCSLDADQPKDLQEQIAWLVSDTSFALYKAGMPEQCYSLAYSQTMPYSGNIAEVFDETSPVMKAITYNADLCAKAVKKKLGEFVAAKPCGDQCFGFPEGGSSLAFGPSSKDEDEMHVCGDVFLVKGKQRTKLTVTDGNLSESSTCCNVADISFQKRGADWAVMAKSEGRDCNGGTASSSEQHVYVLKGNELALEHTLNATHH